LIDVVSISAESGFKLFWNGFIRSR